MSKKEIERDRPADKGRNNDPSIRDHSGQQPGTGTMSSSPSDASNNKLSETAKDGFDEGRPDPRADRNLDETGNEEDSVY